MVEIAVGGLHRPCGHKPSECRAGSERGHARPRASQLHHGRSNSRRVKPPVRAQTQRVQSRE
eukprot:365271-Chlamydomonas_euryale.AAC.4